MLSEPDKPPESDGPPGPNKIPSVSDESPTPDSLAIKEEIRFALIARTARTNTSEGPRRDDSFHPMIDAMEHAGHRINRINFGAPSPDPPVAIWLTVAVFIIRVLQFVLPTSWRWLTEEQTHDIDKILSGGAFGAFIAKYLSTAIFPDKKR